ncbi:CBS domain-containing protein [Thermomonospora cellulosilytica]|uniref:CBS domain-containing protein n=1 Tax=Thermomonospora cellulosilytica TaxID=1411118 RepID=A0A7W3R9Z4_9ACTN|nr:CBS domain-containing protein [Thermomonospora cellulosilytica]MBA9005204.1 CBS domain-containing protein [Thermomonospora cellulosilytica]
MVRAEQIAERLPVVGLREGVRSAIDLIVRHDAPAVVVTDDDGRPHATLSACDVLGCALPSPVLHSRCLTRVYDEPYADRVIRELTERRVCDLISSAAGKTPTVDGRATAIELVEVMRRTGSPFVIVRLSDRSVGMVTARRILAWVAGAV